MRPSEKMGTVGKILHPWEMPGKLVEEDFSEIPREVEKMTDEEVWAELKRRNINLDSLIGDKFNEFNDDARIAQDNGYLDSNRDWTIKGARFFLQEELKKRVQQDMDMFTKSIGTNAGRRDNNGRKESLKKGLENIAKKYNFDGEVGLRKRENGYLIILKKRTGGNSNLRVVKTIDVTEGKMLNDVLEKYLQENNH